jgi:formylglycine-generating enzyme required for sulfatase activity
MVVIPASEFLMGSPDSEFGRDSDESPQHRVIFSRHFAVGKFAVTFADWDACIAKGGCNGYRPSDKDWGRGNRPVINVSWDDAKAYVNWLSSATAKSYRLLSEAEREYVTRAGTTTPFWWGSSVASEANHAGAVPYPPGNSNSQTRLKPAERTLPVDSFKPNPWGLYQVHGNVSEWMEDCWNNSYRGAPSDGSAWISGDCSRRVLRGGSWSDSGSRLRAADRDTQATIFRSTALGFRVARTLSP